MNALEDWMDRQMNPYRWFKGAQDVWNDVTSSSSYSDYVSKANGRTNGWFSTVMGAIPVASGIHNALLGRDSANDILANTGQSWSDVLGYNTRNLTGGTSASIGSAVGQGQKIADGVHDLYEFYTGEKALRKSFDANIIAGMYR